MRAAVPGKGGRRGNRQAWVGGGALEPTGPAFVRLSGAARSRALLRMRRRRLGCALGPAGARGGYGGGGRARSSAAGTRSRAGVRLRASRREVFTSRGL